jgi:cation diffusion facilitator family transporter
MHQDSKKAVIAALFANLGIAVFKLVASVFSGSSSMLAEGYHSLSDTFNQVLLLYGLRCSRKAPDEKHPFGHGKEQFFWSFMVAVILFGIAGTLSIREGWHNLHHPEPISHLWLMYMAIGIGIVFDGYALRLAVKNIKKEMQEEKHNNFLLAIKNSKDPTTLAVFFEDLLALVGLGIAFIGITLASITGILFFDALASIIIGALLMVFASLLAYETKEMLVGEAVTKTKRQKILQVVRSFPEVNKVISLKTMHLGPDEVLVNLEINYSDELVVDRLEEINDQIEAQIKSIIPGARVYLEAENQ